MTTPNPNEDAEKVLKLLDEGVSVIHSDRIATYAEGETLDAEHEEAKAALERLRQLAAIGILQTRRR